MDMNYLINNEAVRCIKEGISYVLAELWVSSAADLPAADGITGRVLLPGTIAVVQAESAIYIMGFDEQWKEWGADNTSGTSAAASTANSLDLSPRAIDRTALAEAANAAAIAAAINDDEIIAVDEPEQEEPEPDQEEPEPEPEQEEPEPEQEDSEPEQEESEPDQEEPEPEQEAEEQPEQAEPESVKDGDADAEIYGGTESI